MFDVITCMMSLCKSIPHQIHSIENTINWMSYMNHKYLWCWVMQYYSVALLLVTLKKSDQLNFTESASNIGLFLVRGHPEVERFLYM